ncbi:MAG: two-component system, OmpR family, response regulator MprA [Chloroflexota bacterium]|jgi:two-component system response regulator MprA|nr:two-component system, OmpR family, response regulator MprA [Chloroflexota bacterium]
MNVLLVEDDPAVRGAVERALRHAGHQPALASDGVRALEQATAVPYDAVILDLGLPGLDGLEVCRRLRTAGNRVPVLMLTARAAVTERVSGLDAGADDYLVKPFALDELLARLRALERRAPSSDQDRGQLRFGDLVIDRDAMTCSRGGREIQLSRTEYQLLELLLANQGKVLSRDVIFDKVWGYDFGPESNSLDVYVGYLRRKLEADGEPRIIHTVRGVGYVMREQ